MKIVLASKNPHKLVEIQQILSGLPVELISEAQLGIDIEVEETGETFEENSLLKAKAVMEATGHPALADDSGIAVDYLGGAPGVHSARYGNDPSLDDWGRLLLLLKNMEAAQDGMRSARFVSVITLAMPSGKVIQARGEAEGVLLREAHGQGGFGYDPIFYYPPAGKTFAELTADEKNAVSHRAIALKRFYEKLRKEIEHADK